MDAILNFFRWQGMIKPAQIRGEIPSNKAIYKRTYQIAWPSAVESVLIALIGAVDLMMVGNLGSASIAAVGITNQPKFLVLADDPWRSTPGLPCSFPAAKAQAGRRKRIRICARRCC